MNTKIVKAALILGALTSVNAQADSIYTDYYVTGQGSAAEVGDFRTLNISVDQFDSSLGTLDSVHIVLFGTSDMHGSINNLSNQTLGLDIFAGLDWKIDGPSGNSIAQGESTLGYFLGGTVLAGSAFDTSIAASTFVIAGGEASDISPFIGNGTTTLGCTSTVSDLDYTDTITGQAFSSSDLDGSLVGYSKSCDVTLTYSYTPIASVPEPTSLILMGIGLGFIGVTRKRKLSK